MRFDSSTEHDNMSIDLTPVVERTRKDRALSNPESPRERLLRRNATESSVRHLLPALGLDELRVVETVVSRLVAARADYGELDLDSDPRDWKIEGAAEMADFLFYAAAREVADNDRRLERLRCEAADELSKITEEDHHAHLADHARRVEQDSAPRILDGLRELRDAEPVITVGDWPGLHDLGGEAG